MNKCILLVCMIAMLLTGGSAFATLKVAPLHTTNDADEQWNPEGYGPLGQDWTNPENWWHNAVVTKIQKAKIDRIPGPIIKTPVEVNQIFIAEGNNGVVIYPSCTAYIESGADVNVGQIIILGYYPDDIGKLQMDDGNVTVNSHMFVGYKGKGTLIMNGGTLNVLGNFVVSFQGGNGTLQLNGGTLHLKQFNYEWPWQEKVNPSDPNVPITPGIAAIDIAGGQIVHDSNATDCYAVASVYEGMASIGKLTAYAGQGDIIVRVNPSTYQVTVGAVIPLWDYQDITVTSHSTMDNDALYGIDKMFRSRINDSNASIFLDGPGPGGLYYAEWQTAADVNVNSIEMIAERDSDPNHFRAVRHFTLKAKVPSSSPTFNVILYDGDVNYTTDIYDLIYNLPATVKATYFRAEFIGNDVKAPRIRKLNAVGQWTNQHLWNFNQILIQRNSSPFIIDPCQPGMFDISNMFEPRRFDNKSTVFQNGTGSGYVYNVTFRPIAPGEVHSFEFIAETDVNSLSRMTTHFKLMAKSIGSATYDKTLYDVNIAPSDYNNNVYSVNVTLSPANYVIGQEFRAEFTGGSDVNGVRIRELNALGVPTQYQQLWDPGNIVIGDRSPYQINVGLYDIDNAFQTEGTIPDPCSDAAVFEDLGSGYVYYVEWKTRSNVTVNAFSVLATHDSASAPVVPNGRAMKHLTVKAKSVGSSTYDLTLYDANIAVPYGASYDPNVLDLWVNLPTPITSSQFRAEFTGNDAYGIRLNELNALGTIHQAVNGDTNNDQAVDLKDFATFAGFWKTDTNNPPPGTTTLEDFESYSTLPNSTWANWLGQSSSAYNFIYLDTSVFHGGSKSLKWTYDLDPSIVIGDDRSGVVYTLATPVDLKNYSKFRVWVYRKSGNSLENYLGARFYWAGTLHDSRVQAEAKVLSASGSTQLPVGWSEWVVDLKNDLYYTNKTTTSIDDIYNVGIIVFYVCNRLQFQGGAGTLNLDDVALTGKCTSSVADFNGDCKVDFQDLKKLADNWLVGK